MQKHQADIPKPRGRLWPSVEREARRETRSTGGTRTLRRLSLLALGLIAVTGALAITALATVAAPAQAAPASFTLITFGEGGNCYVVPLSDLILPCGERRTWYPSSDWYTGPRGYSYRMYRYGGTEQCLDVKGGAATAGAELTTSPCEWHKNSQWWSADGGTLTAWHAANNNLVATSRGFGSALKRLVLDPRVGPNGSTKQRPFRIYSTQIPH